MNIDFDLKLFSYSRRILIAKNIVQNVIISALILFVVLASYWGTQQIFMLLIVAVIGIVGFLLLLNYPNLGYLALLAGGMFVPMKGPGGFNVAILVIILMSALWVGDMFIVKKRFDVIKSRVLQPIYYFLVITVIAFGMGQINWYTLGVQAPFDTQLGGFAIYFFCAFTMLMTANRIKDLRWLQAFVWTFVAFGTVYVLGNAAELPIVDELYSPGIYANSMFWMWMVAIVLGQALFNHQISFTFRMVLIGIVAATFLVAFVQQNDWKSGWVPAVVAAVGLLAVRFKRLALASIPFAILAAMALSQQLISTDEYSYSTRVDAWLVVLDISRVNPIFGLGFANYYWYALLFPLRGYFIQFNSHSQYVDLVAQTGVVGLACFLWILYEVGWLGWKMTQEEHSNGFVRGYIFAVTAAIPGILMAAYLVDWVLPFAYNIGLDGFRSSIYPWVFFGGLVAIKEMQLTGKKL